MTTIPAYGGRAWELAAVVWGGDEPPADSERSRRPVGSLTRLGILAAGEFDEEAAAKLVGVWPRDGVNIALGRIGGLAVQFHLPAPESQRKQESRRWSDAPFAVSRDDEVQTFGKEIETVGFNADLGAGAGVVEPHFAGSTVQLFHEPIRKDATEWQTGARHDDAHIERRASGCV